MKNLITDLVMAPLAAVLIFVGRALGMDCGDE